MQLDGLSPAHTIGHPNGACALAGSFGTNPCAAAHPPHCALSQFGTQHSAVLHCVTDAPHSRACMSARGVHPAVHPGHPVWSHVTRQHVAASHPAADPIAPGHTWLEGAGIGTLPGGHPAPPLNPALSHVAAQHFAAEQCPASPPHTRADGFGARRHPMLHPSHPWLSHVASQHRCSVHSAVVLPELHTIVLSGWLDLSTKPNRGPHPDHPWLSHVTRQQVPALQLLGVGPHRNP